MNKHFEKLMDDYYKVLINTWSESVKESARFAIRELTKLGPEQRANDTFLKDLEYDIRIKMGEDFANNLYGKVRKFVEFGYTESAREPQFGNADLRSAISFTPSDTRNIEMLKKQQLFWLKNHYDAETSEKLKTVLAMYFEERWTNKQLAENLQTHFKDTIKSGESYFAGLAEHTGLRIREYGSLANYKRLGFRRYKIVAVMDDRTSDICRALNGKIFDVENAFNQMEEILSADYKNYQAAKEFLKEKCPFINKEQVHFNSKEQPDNIEGYYFPLPPFHWRCRTETIGID